MWKLLWASVILGFAVVALVLWMVLVASFAGADPTSCRGNGRWACPTPTPTVVPPTPTPMCEVLRGRIRYDAGSDWVEVWDAVACW